MTSTTAGTASRGGIDAMVDVEFEVIADDIHAVGRSMRAGQRSPTHLHAIVFVTIGVVFWWLGSPVGALMMVAFGAVVYANPRIGFLERWWARRMAGNRIGSRWHIWAGPEGIGFTSHGLDGSVAWSAIESVIVGEEAIVLMGPNHVVLVSIPRRAMTPSQVDALADLARQHAPNAKLVG